MRKLHLVGIGLVTACLLLTASCAQAPQASQQSAAQESETVDEGADTPVTVSYGGNHAGNADCFLSEGDSVAVISPSAPPSQEQVDAVVAGLKGWGYVPVEGKHVVQQDRTLADCSMMGWSSSSSSTTESRYISIGVHSAQLP